MATLSINNMFAKGFKNKTSWTKMVWWKTNFNMPVPNIFDNNTTFTKSQWMLDPLDEWTTFDLSWYNQGWEVIAAATIFVFEWEITDFWLVTIKQKWIRPDWYSPWENSYNLAIQEQASGQWQWWQLASNQWVAPWEINQSWTYELEVSMSWAYNMTKSFYVTFTNVPSFTWYKTPWYIWVEWDDLKYVSANWFVHTVEGTNVWAVGWDPWSIWIESTGSNNFHYINDGGDNNIAPWKIEQFASVFSWWATSAVSWESPWYLYADNEFWFTHLSYIWNDWKKYLIWDWHYPYTNPY